MANTEIEYHADRDWAYFKGRATANSDESFVYPLPTPMRTFTVSGVRASSGNFTFTLQGSANGTDFGTLATCTVTGGTDNITHAVDKPVSFVKVVFSNVGSATVTYCVLGVK